MTGAVGASPAGIRREHGPADTISSAHRRERSGGGTSPVPALIPLAGWVVLVGVSAIWGRWLIEQGQRMYVNAPPLTGRWDPRLSLRASLAVAAAIAAVAFVPMIAERARWRWVLIGAFAAAAVWAASLAFADGAFGLIRSPSSPLDYLRNVALVGSPGTFLGTFVDRIDAFTPHVRAHPPGMVLLLWGVDRIGLSGPWPIAILEILVGAAAVPAALLACREIAGEQPARRAAPFVAIAPVAVFVASSGDALFAGVGAWAVALVVLATGRQGRRSHLLAIGGGVLFGMGLFLSYGLALLGAIPLVVAVARRRPGPLMVATAAAAAVVLTFAAFGFWWVEGLLATRLQYLASVARRRPYGYFLLANLAAFAVALGPAIAVALARLRDRRAWLLVGGALAAVLLADVSGMSKAEVERIWLPFAPWVLLAMVAFQREARRAWLALQIGTALMLQATVISPW